MWERVGKFEQFSWQAVRRFSGTVLAGFLLECGSCTFVLRDIYEVSPADILLIYCYFWSTRLKYYWTDYSTLKLLNVQPGKELQLIRKSNEQHCTEDREAAVKE